MRRLEVLQLQSSEVDLQRGYIWLPVARTKGKKARAVPLSPTAQNTLRAHLKPTAPWVFANPKTGKPYFDVSPWWEKSTVRAKVFDCHFHDLRHTFASKFIQRGGSERTLQEILGHKSVTMTRRYNHLEPSHLKDEFDRIW